MSDYDCELVTQTGEPCKGARRVGGTVRFGTRHFCRKHYDDLIRSLHWEKEDPASDAARDLRRLVHQWDSEEAVDALMAEGEADIRRREQLAELGREQRESTVVYYVRRDDFIKIGWTTNLEKRLASLANGGTKCPPGMTIGPVTLLACHGGDKDAEKAAHRLFRLHRVIGEWFRPAPELLAHIAAIRDRQINQAA